MFGNEVMWGLAQQVAQVVRKFDGEKVLDRIMGRGAFQCRREPFRLNSGRDCPYRFRNTEISDAASMLIMGEALGNVLVAEGLECDALYGVAQQGIPHAIATMFGLMRYNINVENVFNRESNKERAEDDQFVGARIAGKRIVIIDNALSSGRSLANAMESLHTLRRRNAIEVVAGVVLVDRNERSFDGASSAADLLYDRYGLKTYAVLGLPDVIEYIKRPDSPMLDVNGSDRVRILADIATYQEEYGA
jgi:orotate phosphoribosyltransferase